jgi:hypothetical protein
MMALAERSNEDSSSKIQSVMEDLRRVENEVRTASTFSLFISFYLSIFALFTFPSTHLLE